MDQWRSLGRKISNGTGGQAVSSGAVVFERLTDNVEFWCGNWSTEARPISQEIAASSKGISFESIAVEFVKSNANPKVFCERTDS